MKLLLLPASGASLVNEALLVRHTVLRTHTVVVGWCVHTTAIRGVLTTCTPFDLPTWTEREFFTILLTIEELILVDHTVPTRRRGIVANGGRPLAMGRSIAVVTNLTSWLRRWCLMLVLVEERRGVLPLRVGGQTCGILLVFLSPGM